MDLKPVSYLCGAGHAPVDMVAAVDDAYLAQHGLRKGSVVQIAYDQVQTLIATLPSVAEIPGGSVGNTIACHATLGGATGFMGRLLPDRVGLLSIDEMASRDIAFNRPDPAIVHDAGTSLVFCLTTPDAERSFASYSGGGNVFAPDDIAQDLLAATDYAVFDGFTLARPETVDGYLEVARRIRAQGGQSGLIIGAVGMLIDFPDRMEAVMNAVDGLFLNETEAAHILGLEDPAAAAVKLASHYALGVVTHGARGAYVFKDGEVAYTPSVKPPASVVDTCGAGDNFVGGFLYGLRHGYDLKDAGHIGHICAADVITRFGARLPLDFVLPPLHH
jgi:sugar/nucleoside kinase (ribokinase family)